MNILSIGIYTYLFYTVAKKLAKIGNTCKLQYYGELNMKKRDLNKPCKMAQMFFDKLIFVFIYDIDSVYMKVNIFTHILNKYFHIFM